MHTLSISATVLTTILLSACSSSTQSTKAHQTDQSTQSIWVAKDLDLKQCEQLSAQDALDRTQQLLKQNHITVSTASCADDGMMRIQLCGSPQGKLGLYKIKQSQLGKAQSLGFKHVQSRQYQSIACS